MDTFEKRVRSAIAQFLDGKIESPRVIDEIRDTIQLADDAAREAVREYPHDFGTEELCPVSTSLATLEILTEQQRFRLSELIRSYSADSAMVWRDGFSSASVNVRFSLYRGREQNSSSAIVDGLIEGDGRAHT